MHTARWTKKKKKRKSASVEKRQRARRREVRALQGEQKQQQRTKRRQEREGGKRDGANLAAIHPHRTWGFITHFELGGLSPTSNLRVHHPLRTWGFITHFELEVASSTLNLGVYHPLWTWGFITHFELDGLSPTSNLGFNPSRGISKWNFVVVLWSLLDVFCSKLTYQIIVCWGRILCSLIPRLKCDDYANLHFRICGFGRDSKKKKRFEKNDKNQLLQNGTDMNFEVSMSARGTIGDNQARKLDTKRIYTRD